MTTLIPLIEDPFPQVQAEVQTKIQRLKSQQSQLPPNKFKSELQTLSHELHDLESALDIARTDPSRFNLSRTELHNRNNVISEMKQSLNSLSTDEYIEDELGLQTMQMREQDERLDDLSSAVQRIGHLGRDMHDELEQQGQLLDDLDNRFDGTLSRLKAIRQRVDRVIEQTGRKQFCTIVWLSITFLILTILIVVT